MVNTRRTRLKTVHSIENQKATDVENVIPSNNNKDRKKNDKPYRKNVPKKTPLATLDQNVCSSIENLHDKCMKEKDSPTLEESCDSPDLSTAGAVEIFERERSQPKSSIESNKFCTSTPTKLKSMSLKDNLGNCSLDLSEIPASLDLSGIDVPSEIDLNCTTTKSSPEKPLEIDEEPAINKSEMLVEIPTKTNVKEATKVEKKREEVAKITDASKSSSEDGVNSSKAAVKIVKKKGRKTKKEKEQEKEAYEKELQEEKEKLRNLFGQFKNKKPITEKSDSYC